MKKMLVTTDLSDRSKAGLYFALQLASQSPFDLRFFHSYHTVTGRQGNKAEIELADKAEEMKVQKKLESFVKEIFKKMKQVMPADKCIVRRSVIAQSNIMEYAAQEHFDFICMSTRGAGKIDRFFGTNTTNIMSQSAIPVIAVPYQYKPRKIKKILYASDMIHLERELEKIVSFAKPMKAKLELLHFTSPLEILMDKKSVGIVVEKLSRYNIKIDLEDLNSAQSLVSNIESAVRKKKPSMMIMFTEQNRSFFQKLFNSGNSAEYAFNPEIPLLVFNKSS
jgi:nucleotide-binding universal stress UspA family protein